jgi:hypothetical protein
MQLFLKSQEVWMWLIITDGDYVPMATSALGIVSIKPKEAWALTEQQKVS